MNRRFPLLPKHTNLASACRLQTIVVNALNAYPSTDITIAKTSIAMNITGYLLATIILAPIQLEFSSWSSCPTTIDAISLAVNVFSLLLLDDNWSLSFIRTRILWSDIRLRVSGASSVFYNYSAENQLARQGRLGSVVVFWLSGPICWNEECHPRGSIFLSVHLFYECHRRLWERSVTDSQCELGFKQWSMCCWGDCIQRRATSTKKWDKNS